MLSDNGRSEYQQLSAIHIADQDGVRLRPPQMIVREEPQNELSLLSVYHMARILVCLTISVLHCLWSLLNANEPLDSAG